MRYYPVGLNLHGKDVLMVGAGRIAERKIKSLLSHGANVRVVSPEAVTGIRALADKKKIIHMNRKYRPSDLKGASLVIAATSDSRVNGLVARQARSKGIWVNVVDDTKKSEFISTAVIRRGKIVISISTDGREPKLSKDFRRFLEEKLDAFNFSRD